MLDSEPETEKMLHLPKKMSTFHSDFTFEIDF